MNTPIIMPQMRIAYLTFKPGLNILMVMFGFRDIHVIGTTGGRRDEDQR